MLGRSGRGRGLCRDGGDGGQSRERGGSGRHGGVGLRGGLLVPLRGRGQIRPARAGHGTER